MMFDRKAEGRYWDFGWQLIEGCTRIADGCKHCWSLDKERRFRKETGIVCHEERLERPLKRRKPASYAVWNDLFHKDVEIGFLTHVFDTIKKCPQHIFLILTKRPEQALRMMWGKHGRGWRYFGAGDFHPNVWFGVSCSTQADADKNIPILLQIPAAVRFVSLEPLLEEVYLPGPLLDHGFGFEFNQKPERIKWVIIGAESIGNQPGRPCKIEWVRDIVRHCEIGGIACFVKQLHINGKLSKNPEEWPEDLRVREYPELRK